MRIFLLRFLVVGFAVLLLEILCDARLVARTIIIPPSAMAVSLWHILEPSSGLYPDIAATLIAVVVAAVCASLGGFLAGLALHAAPRLRAAVAPLLASYYAVPTFIFYPVFIVLLGAGRGPIIAIAFLLAVVAMISSTLVGLDRIPPAWRRTARVLRLGAVQTACLVVLPGLAPSLFSGLRLVVAYAFIGVIASEFILSGQGLGYAIANAYNNFDNAAMYGLMLLIVIAVSTVNLVLYGLDRRLQARRQR